MKKLLLMFILLIITCRAFAHNGKHPTIVLVHGALLTSSSFAPLQSYLQNQGYNVITIDMPGRVNDKVLPKEATLMAAVKKVCKVVEMQKDPVLLVGHSQAGAIITQATNNCGAYIKGLVYVAAVLPLSGEKVFDLLSEQDNRHFEMVAPIDNNTGLAKPDHKAPLKEFFMGDANDDDAKRAINNMVPEPIVLGDGVLNYDQVLFNQIPKFYIKTSKDLIISPETQDKYIKRQNIKNLYILDTGHSPFISQPHLLGKKLISIYNSLSG